MKRMVSSLTGVALIAAGSLAMAQTAGGEMMGGEGRGGYGMMGGYMAGWIVYGLIKAAVVIFGLWILHRIAKAVEKIAASKS
jgi:uncharacterized membrane protein